ncbi:hypothetical protein [uncultured Sphingomonas sp.]|uniref:hypothetical protein n=1 Tax=uncultured Sphingomonas sp. TaxID=158754 RepID=UPI0035CCA3BB
MSTFDHAVVGNSAGAVPTARLGEHPDVVVALLEAGDRPPEREAMPAACASPQLGRQTDQTPIGDPGKGGRGFRDWRMPVRHGKMLGGSSGTNWTCPGSPV